MKQISPMPETPPHGWSFRLGWRSGFISAFTDDKSQNGAGFVWAMLPVLRWVSGDKKELADRLQRHSDRYLGYGELDGVTLGAVARLELEGQGEKARELKCSAAGLLETLESDLFQHSIRPFLIALVILILVALPWKELAVAIILLTLLMVNNIVGWTVRFSGVRWGWALGEKIYFGLSLLPVKKITTPLAWGGAAIAGLLLTVNIFGYHEGSHISLVPSGLLGALIGVAAARKLNPVLGFLAAWVVGVLAMIR